MPEKKIRYCVRRKNSIIKNKQFAIDKRRLTIKSQEFF